MSRFYVGQRVRIKWSRGWPELSGTEGSVASEGRMVIDCGTGLPIFGYVICPDAWGCITPPRRGSSGGSRFSATADQIEPLIGPSADTRDRNTVIPWDECLWRPKVAA